MLASRADMLRRHQWVVDHGRDVYQCVCHGYVVGTDEVPVMIAHMVEVWPSATMWAVDDFLNRLVHRRAP